MRCRIARATPSAEEDPIEYATDGLNPARISSNDSGSHDEGGDFQLLKFGQEVSPEKSARGQYQIRTAV